MKLILRVIDLNDFNAYAVPACAFVDLTRADARHWLKFKKAADQLMAAKTFYALTFYDGSAVPLCEDEIIEGLTEELASVVADDYSPPETLRFRRDCMLIRLTENGLLWYFYEKHSSCRYETEHIAWDLVEAVAAGLKVEPDRAEPSKWRWKLGRERSKQVFDSPDAAVRGYFDTSATK